MIIKTLFSKLTQSSNEEILFIVGSGRSGNTILRKLLMENFPIYIPPETYVLNEVISADSCINGFGWNRKVDFLLSILQFNEEFKTFELANLNEFAISAKSWPEQKQTVGELYYQLYRWIGIKHGFEFRYVGDKTPINTMCLGLIKSVWPNAKYIYIERDPFDVCNSYVKAGIYNSPSVAAKRWSMSKLAWNRHKARLDNNMFIELRYESLVSNPKKFLNKVHEQFGYEFRDETIQLNKGLGDVGWHKHHSNVNKPITTNSIGKGKKELNSAQIKIIKSEIDRVL